MKEKLKEEEAFYWKIKRYSGPKTPSKVGVSVFLFICFMIGFMILAKKPMPTGYAISEIKEKSFGLVLLFIPFIFLLNWLKRFKSMKT